MYIVTGDGGIIKQFQVASAAEKYREELAIKGYHPSLIEREGSVEKKWCLVPNNCKKTICCNFCKETKCDSRCVDDCTKCKYLCIEEDAISAQPGDRGFCKRLEETKEVKETKNIEKIETAEKVNNTSNVVDKKQRMQLIIQDLKDGMKVKDVADKYGLSTARITFIKKNSL